MEKSRPSEDEILRLGTKIVEELGLEHTSNTLVRWMIHYISELMEKADNAISEKEEKRLKEECCETILELWRNKEFLPIRKPLQNLGPVLEILEVFKQRDFHISPRWLEYRSLPRNNRWAGFVDLVKNNTEKVFYHSMEVNFNEDIIFQDKKWLQEHGAFLSEEEKNVIDYLDIMIQLKKGGSIDTNAIEPTSKKERFEHVFNELEGLIEEQKVELLKLKKSMLESFNEQKD